MSNTIPSVILTINVGSSGLKLFLYRMRHSATEVDPDAVRKAGANWLQWPQSNDRSTSQL
jgi:acetate kinase